MDDIASPPGAMPSNRLNQLIFGLENAEFGDAQSKKDGSDDGGDSDDEFEDAVETLDNVDTNPPMNGNKEDDAASEEDDLFVADGDTDLGLNGGNGNEGSIQCDDGQFHDPPPRTLAHMEDRQPAAFDSGYDSDGLEAPKNLTIDEEKELEVEEPLGETPPVQQNDNADVNTEEEVAPNAPVEIPISVLNKLTVPQIKDELRIRNVTFPSRFKREELKNRLFASLELPVVATISSLKNDSTQNLHDSLHHERS